MGSDLSLSDKKTLVDHLSGMDKDAVRLYDDLVWRQFVACQMPAC